MMTRGFGCPSSVGGPDRGIPRASVSRMTSIVSSERKIVGRPLETARESGRTRRTCFTCCIGRTYTCRSERTSSPRRVAILTGTVRVIAVPLPTVEETVTSPPRRETVSSTIASPSPLPERSVTIRLVVIPDRKMSQIASLSVRVASSSAVITSFSTAVLRIALLSTPAPSSATSMPTLLPDRGKTRIRTEPVADFCRALLASGLSMP
ncbi:hypothetical protein DSECCO2_643960 [anaerobic digester metagenome]